MAYGSVPITPGRVLLADGDGLAYYCSGNDETEPGQARMNLTEKLRIAQAACGAESACILLTAAGSHKGHRYAVARVKPYQGQRSSGRRPKNWQYLRELLDSGNIGDIPVEATATAEADDLFGKHSTRLGVDNCVIYTQDKDMRMVPGLHLDWKEHRLITLRDEFSLVRNELQYGRKWFWLQMLHGDSADNIPGLPRYINAKGTPTLCGEVTAGKLLSEAATEDIARSIVFGLYKGWYGEERWRAEVLEQAVLLWMRRGKDSAWHDVMDIGHPLDGVMHMEEWQPACVEIERRITEVPVAQTQDD